MPKGKIQGIFIITDDNKKIMNLTGKTFKHGTNVEFELDANNQPINILVINTNTNAELKSKSVQNKPSWDNIKTIAPDTPTKNIATESYGFVLPAETQRVINGLEFDNYGLMYKRIPVKVANKERYHPYFKEFYAKKNMNKVKLSRTDSILKVLNVQNEKLAGGFFGDCKYIKCTYKPTNKLILGVGGKSPFDNVPTTVFHHVYGIPYIPSSGIKGTVRSYYIKEFFADNEELALKDEKFSRLFGTSEDTGKRGEIIFLDAFPIEAPTLMFESFTPHYGKYYRSSGANPPTDYDRPNPLFFPCITETSFQVYIGKSGNISDEELNEMKLHFKNAMHFMGMGAKTSSGYGIML